MITLFSLSTSALTYEMPAFVIALAIAIASVAPFAEPTNVIVVGALNAVSPGAVASIWKLCVAKSTKSVSNVLLVLIVVEPTAALRIILNVPSGSASCATLLSANKSPIDKFSPPPVLSSCTSASCAVS